MNTIAYHQRTTSYAIRASTVHLPPRQGLANTKDPLPYHSAGYQLNRLQTTYHHNENHPQESKEPITGTYMLYMIPKAKPRQRPHTNNDHTTLPKTNRPDTISLYNFMITPLANFTHTRSHHSTTLLPSQLLPSHQTKQPPLPTR